MIVPIEEAAMTSNPHKDTGRCNTPDGVVHPCSDAGCEHYLPNNMGMAFGNGKTLLPFQEAGVRFLDRNGGVGILNDQPGMGKTCQALGVFAAHPEWRPGIIVSPAIMKYKWEEEALAWLETDDVVEVVKNGKPKTLTGNIIIINYDVLRKWVPELKKINPSIIVYDEIHYCKHATSARSKAAMELAQNIPHRIGLTGTIAENRPSDLWSPLQIIDQAHYPTRRFFSWHLRFCDGHKIFAGLDKNRKPKMVWDFSGASNIEELRESLEQIMLRRTKDDMMPELPTIRRQTLIVPISNRREYNKASKEFLAWIAEQNGPDAAEKAARAEELTKRSHLRRLAIEGKMAACMEWIDNFLLSGEKLIVFAVHKTVIAALMERYGDIAVKIDGSVIGKAKHATEQRFQTDPTIKLFVGNIHAAGVGITLTAASDVLFVELDQVPERHNQAECRAHRYTQKRPVNITYAIADNTIDAAIADMLTKKQIVLNQITGDENTLSFDLFCINRGE